MKYYRILSISIPIGILLSGCATKESREVPFLEKTSKAKKVFIAPLPNYVKHNEGIFYKSKMQNDCSSPTVSVAYIYIELISPNNDNKAKIRYIITDKWRATPGEWHRDGAANEMNSTIFTAPIDYNAGLIITCNDDKDNEVKIKATSATDSTTLTWKSNSKGSNDSDQYYDVKWDH